MKTIERNRAWSRESMRKRRANDKAFVESERKYQKEYQKEYRLRLKDRCNLKKHNQTRIKRFKKDGTVTDSIIVFLTENVKICKGCGSILNDSNRHIDHIKPIAKGGIHSVFNIWPLCNSCNLEKNAFDPYEFNDKMHKHIYTKGFLIAIEKAASENDYFLLFNTWSHFLKV